MARPFVELYINDKKVYFQNPPEIFVTYAHTELHNPTVIKNSYTKTITIEGTPENNRIFNDFYDMRRINNGELFNPSRKESFTLYRNGEPMESGYVKLDKVNKKNGRITYDITLYGGLGQFLYNLQYKEDGEQMKLSDLDFGGGDKEFDFEINKETIANAWNRVNYNKTDEENKVFDTINFAPCYNGIPKDFSADKVAIDVNSFKSNAPDIYNKFKTIIKDGGKTYATVDGWLVGELKKEYDEWQMKCLMAYQQRPIFRFKNIIQACCNPQNNGGYKVDLDVDFFSTQNPYYENAWMTLPLINEMDTVEVKDETEIKYNYQDGKITVDGLENGDVFSFKIPFKMNCKTYSQPSAYLRTDSYSSSWDGSDESAVQSFAANSTRYVQLIAYDSNDKIVGGSSVWSFHSDGYNDFYYSYVYKSSLNVEYGGYWLQDDKTYCFNDKSYNLLLKNVKYEDGMYFKVIEQTATASDGLGASPYELFYSYGDEIDGYESGKVTVEELYVDLAIDNITTELSISAAQNKVNKKRLLNSEKTPCDYFLSYLKLFNLHIWKDMYENKIYIRQRPNYFIDEKYDIDDYIDRGNNITITPLTFENKWLNFNFETVDDTALAKDYVDEFGIKYGCQKVDTNYNFDSSSKDIFSDNVFKGTIQCRGKSKYYINLYENDADNMPPFVLDGFQTLLFDGNGDTAEGTYFTPKTSTLVSQDWWKEKYYDFMPKPSFVNDKNEPVDGANVLLFYNGPVEMKDNNGNRLWMAIADNIPQFEKLNEGQPCWIWSMNWKVVNNTLDHFPLFSRYITNENGWVTHSWDFGTPKYLYVPDYTIDDTSNLYTQYWKPYIRDMYDVNTRIIECRVLLLERVVGDWLKRFYYFDGSYWILNKITDYNPTSNGTTKCEFVRVNNINNYLS